MKLFIILGNQLFPIDYLDNFRDDHIFFMAEDYGFCSNFNHHKNKILLFLSSMRSYADKLKEAKLKYIYNSLDDHLFKISYIEKLFLVIKKHNITEVTHFEIEDKGFEYELKQFLEKNKISFNIIKSPMFLNSREDFKNFIASYKKPLVANFYKISRKRFNILIDENENPIGGKWSYDQENRKKLPKNITIPKFPRLNQTIHTINLKKIIEREFPKNIGSTNNFWFATTYEQVIKLLDFFIQKKFFLFGDYEDAVDKRDDILFHSALSPYLNLGLITPDLILKTIMKHDKNIPLNSIEGFIRQIIGWREFIRGIYNVKGSVERTTNFFRFNRKIPSSFYDGTTGILPVDITIKKVQKTAYNHHIERLMVIGNFMMLCEFDPDEVYRWFMEHYVDAYDWVMVPNVYGMSQFADGGLMSSKPYISSSNYLKKMSDFPDGDWRQIWDGLYWRFIDLNRELFNKNIRMKFMVNMLDKMTPEKKESHFKIAKSYLSKLDQS